jgi:flavorubredoxin
METPSADFAIFREFAPGAAWLGGCLVIDLVNPPIHSHMNAFIVRGGNKAAMIDTGHPMNWAAIRKHLREFLGGSPLDYVIPTHEEYPHAGNLGGLLADYPQLQVIGDTRNYHMYYPDSLDHFRPMPVGESIDLGGREVHILPAPLHDLPNTVWAYDTQSCSMFVSDGFTYSHEHLSGECSLLTSELGRIPSEQDILFANESALHWTKYVDTDPVFGQIEELLSTYPTTYIAPAHGNVIDEPEPVVALMKQQLKTLKIRHAGDYLVNGVSGGLG